MKKLVIFSKSLDIKFFAFLKNTSNTGKYNSNSTKPMILTLGKRQYSTFSNDNFNDYRSLQDSIYLGILGEWSLGIGSLSTDKINYYRHVHPSKLEDKNTLKVIIASNIATSELIKDFVRDLRALRIDININVDNSKLYSLFMDFRAHNKNLFASKMTNALDIVNDCFNKPDFLEKHHPRNKG
jgi:hypothetical protein